MDKNDMLYQLVPSAKLLASLYEGEEVRLRDTVLFVDKELGKGSHGTVVYEGSFNGYRSAAVKVFSRVQYDAQKGLRNHYLTFNRMNLVNLFVTEKDKNFVYVAMERCDYNLHQGIVVGLRELHKLRIIHGDLRPSHVLISKEKDVLYPKLSEAKDFFSGLLNFEPELREACLRAKSKDEKARSIVAALESKACVAFYGTWDCSMDRAFITQVIKHRQFRYDSVQDLLRFIAIASKKYRFFR
ncbi:hypothetical protein L1987_53945 [Smallanthus sonchifolius]|uniref:Uncharacterized protein n=1 Tax=Smallanthus sonchifolius TaxID=185202 RepID=A0ACB9E6R0_9ASTR|nr:hypothetical protein L1987_53945 [Smallanthus sonchifolius]